MGTIIITNIPPITADSVIEIAPAEMEKGNPTRTVPVTSKNSESEEEVIVTKSGEIPLSEYADPYGIGKFFELFPEDGKISQKEDGKQLA